MWVSYKQFIEHLWDSIHTGIHLDKKKKKTNLIGTLAHKVLEVCSPEKVSTKASKIKISCDRMDTQKKSLFPVLKKKFQIFKHPMDLVQKSVWYI